MLTSALPFNGQNKQYKLKTYNGKFVWECTQGDFQHAYGPYETLQQALDYAQQQGNPKIKITKGTVILSGTLYKAFQNTYSKAWYIVQGQSCNGTQVANRIEAKSANQALEIWLSH